MANKVLAWYGQRVSLIGELGSESRVGGLPWGFPAEMWPLSPGGEPMTFIGQFQVGSDTPAKLEEFTVYLFFMKSFDEDGEPYFENWETESGETSILFVKNKNMGLTQGPGLDFVDGIEWKKGWSWDFDTVDDLSDDLRESLDQEDDQPQSSSMKFGGGIRWWQGGQSHPIGLDGKPMRHILSFCSTVFPGLDKMFADANIHIFYDESNPSIGAVVWEHD